MKAILHFSRLADDWLARLEEGLIVLVFLALLSGGVAICLTHTPLGAYVALPLITAGGLIVSFALLKGGRGYSRHLLGGVLLLSIGGFSLVSTGVDALLRLLTLALALLGASLSVRLRSHVAIELLTRFVPPKIRRWVDAFANAGSCVILISLFPYAMIYATDAFVSDEVAFELGVDGVPIPAAFGKGLLALSMGVMAWRFLVLALEVVLDPDAWDRRRDRGESALT